jgi:ribbon-helix-helix CopG family protein
MHKTTLYLDPEIYGRLMRRAEATGETQASIVREALLTFLRGAAPRPKSVGMGRSGSGDLNERANDSAAPE